MGNIKKPICMLGLHSDEVYKELILKNHNNTEIGIVIINRCLHCGRIKDTKVRTIDTM